MVSRRRCLAATTAAVTTVAGCAAIGDDGRREVEFVVANADREPTHTFRVEVVQNDEVVETWKMELRPDTIKHRRVSLKPDTYRIRYATDGWEDEYEFDVSCDEKLEVILDYAPSDEIIFQTFCHGSSE